MKTPLQKAIHKFKDNINVLEKSQALSRNDSRSNHIDRLKLVIEHLESLLPEERKSHEDMHLAGQERGFNGKGYSINFASEFFEKTFNSK